MDDLKKYYFGWIQKKNFWCMEPTLNYVCMTSIIRLSTLTTNLVSESGGRIDEGSSEVAVDVGVQGEGVVLVLSLQHSGLGSVKNGKNCKIYLP